MHTSNKPLVAICNYRLKLKVFNGCMKGFEGELHWLLRLPRLRSREETQQRAKNGRPDAVPLQQWSTLSEAELIWLKVRSLIQFRDTCLWPFGILWEPAGCHCHGFLWECVCLWCAHKVSQIHKYIHILYDCKQTAERNGKVTCYRALRKTHYYFPKCILWHPFLSWY